MLVVELRVDFESCSKCLEELRVEVPQQEYQGVVRAQGGFVKEACCTTEGNANWGRAWIELIQ
jgi:hypothetical protein